MEDRWGRCYHTESYRNDLNLENFAACVQANVGPQDNGIHNISNIKMKSIQAAALINNAHHLTTTLDRFQSDARVFDDSCPVVGSE